MITGGIFDLSRSFYSTITVDGTFENCLLTHRLCRICKTYASHDKTQLISYIVDLCFREKANLAYLLTKYALRQTDFLKY
jgi:hypothetical protein